MTSLAAPYPLETPAVPIGRRSTRIADAQGSSAGERHVDVECWYPSTGEGRGEAAEYEVLPGISLRSAVAVEGAAPAAGEWPVVVFSHGRTGTSIAYSSLCEALAARGCIVLAPLHRGDSLGDWLSGTQVDDAANEATRLADARAVLRMLADPHAMGLMPAAPDLTRIVMAGHSYGAFTAFAAAASDEPSTADLASRPSAVLAYQPYTRMLADDLLATVRVPVLLVASELDRTTPPATDADRPWALVTGRPSWRLDLLGAGHQAASDTALYAELAHHVPSLPEIVRAYLAATVDQLPAGRTWRDLLRVQVETSWQFLTAAWSGESPASARAPDSGVLLTRRDR